MGIDNCCVVRNAKYSHNDQAIDAFCIAPPSVTYKCTAIASTDPFAGKTNKYAESKIIRVVSTVKNCYIRFGDVDIGDATNEDYVILKDKEHFFAIDANYPYVRVIDTGATIFITEIY